MEVVVTRGCTETGTQSGCAASTSLQNAGAPLEEGLLYSIVVQMRKFKPSTSPFPAPLSIFLKKKKI